VLLLGIYVSRDSEQYNLALNEKGNALYKTWFNLSIDLKGYSEIRNAWMPVGGRNHFNLRPTMIDPIRSDRKVCLSVSSNLLTRAYLDIVGM
jgi:hypothetical protein